jgi:two-component system response regulator AtoC
VQDNLPHKLLNDKKRGHSLEYLFSGFSIKTGKEILEKNLIQKALEATEGNRTKAAKLLEISHPSLLSKMKVYNILL